MSEVTREELEDWIAFIRTATATWSTGIGTDIWEARIDTIRNLALERLDMEPRPIADAPMDGTEIFAYWDDEWVKTYWVKRNGFEGWQLPSGRPIKAYAPETWRPTHFIPLSSLPKPKGT